MLKSLKTGALFQ